MTGVHLMSESNPEAVQDSASSSVNLTAGAMLKAAREASGLHVAALAVSMKVPVKKLEALEADRLDLLPDAVFVRALASSVCRALHIDAAPVLEKLPQTVIPRLNNEERGINAPFHTPGQQGHTTVGDVIGRPGVMLVVALMVGALILVFFPEGPTPVETSEVVAPSSAIGTATVALPMVIPAPVSASEPLAGSKAQTESVQVPPTPAPAVVPATTPSSAALTTARPLVAGSSPSATLSSPAVPLPVASAGRQLTGVAGAGPDVAGAAAGLVGFAVKGSSWVEVTDAKGVVQLRRTLAAGETAFATGAVPLSVVVGRVDVTEVTVRGKPYSLADLSKDNVARFEVK